jgi:hyperosmotically inducible protein
MTSKPRTWILPAFAAALLFAGTAVITTAQEPETKTTSEKIKEKLGNAASSIKKGALSAEEAIKEQYARARDSVTKMGVEARVYARIHWDRDLHDAKIELSSPKKGVIKLTGAVADVRLKEKAAKLALETLGVMEVEDTLTVQTTTSTTTTKTETVKP